MQTTALMPQALGLPLDTSPESFGQMHDSIEQIDDIDTLRSRLDQDGYLFLSGYLDRERVLDARREILTKWDREGILDPSCPFMDGMIRTDRPFTLRPDLTETNPPLLEVLYSGAMIELYERLLGEPVRHFDFTWMRAVPRGRGTPPHMDSVYMNRGTQRLFTSWTPLGDISIEQGGLIVMPGSHRIDPIREHYGMKDVDTFCTNLTPQHTDHFGGVSRGGYLTFNPTRLQKALKKPWLTRAEYRAGDVVIFSIYTIHAGLDNQTDRVRLSSDTRYQPACEPVDERWISVNGNKPIGHGSAAKRGRIC